MFLSNYWKIKACLDAHFEVINHNTISMSRVIGWDYGAKLLDGTSAGYISASFTENLFTMITAQMKFIGSGNSVKFATGSHVIDTDDYTIGGTDITSSFSSVTTSYVRNYDSGKEIYIITIAGTYNGSDPTTLQRIGIVKDVYCNSNQYQNYVTDPTHSNILLIEHELETPISLSNGDSINIVLKVTQQ